ncbi:hypothetical protein M9458_021801, partial [Cirrhinus mrigala]
SCLPPLDPRFLLEPPAAGGGAQPVFIPRNETGQDPHVVRAQKDSAHRGDPAVPPLWFTSTASQASP